MYGEKQFLVLKFTSFRDSIGGVTDSACFEKKRNINLSSEKKGKRVGKNKNRHN